MCSGTARRARLATPSPRRCCRRAAGMFPATTRAHCSHAAQPRDTTVCTLPSHCCTCTLAHLMVRDCEVPAHNMSCESWASGTVARRYLQGTHPDQHRRNESARHRPHHPFSRRRIRSLGSGPHRLDAARVCVLWSSGRPLSDGARSACGSMDGGRRRSAPQDGCRARHRHVRLSLGQWR